MKVSGFTFCRDAVRFDYPLVESIRSILPIVDEYVVNVGKSDDATLELVRSIGDPKIRIIESIWDESLRKDGLIFSQQTNLALAQCVGDWAFYLQADEVVHEEDLPRILAAMQQHLADQRVLGLLFRYLHFKGDYQSIDPWMYRREIRVIRNNGAVRSWGDATGFACSGPSGEQGLKPQTATWRQTGARIFHYGWVKDPRTLVQKKRTQITYHHDAAIPAHDRVFFDCDEYGFDQYAILKEYRGSHPAVMAARVAGLPRLARRRNRWLSSRFYREVLRHGFKG
ncbi:MAG: glycosyltransferase [Nitrospirae bacterium]|nr:glycosyltransferase [Nitrospirota bacterium]